jgi:nicotinate-nucleotide pyrophosphorylase (carboxylating)
LKAERLALNFMQRLSGISTYAHKLSSLVRDYDVRVVDTRKTTPGLRLLEKYAVRAGGAYNHRYNLSDAVMIKDNHIIAAGGIKEALIKIKQNIPHTTKVEIEIKNLDQLEEALDHGADIIMLDNMSYEDMKKAVAMTNNRAILEASGGIDEATIVEVAKTGIDVISVGALTHSYDSLDISLNFK